MTCINNTIIYFFLNTVPSVDSSIPIAVKQNVTGDMVDITVLVNVSNKLNYVSHSCTYVMYVKLYKVFIQGLELS